MCFYENVQTWLISLNTNSSQVYGNLKCCKLLVIVEKLSWRVYVWAMHNSDYKKYNKEWLYKIYDH